jgi:hypothetical protein
VVAGATEVDAGATVVATAAVTADEVEIESAAGGARIK